MKILQCFNWPIGGDISLFLRVNLFINIALQQDDLHKLHKSFSP